MKIIRAGFGDTDVFTAAQLEYGACCFYAEDKTESYYFHILGHEATLYASGRKHIDAAIGEFLFYSGFIRRITDSGGRLLTKRDPAQPKRMEISAIQPSQFYINRRKLDACKGWITEAEDIIIPIAHIGKKTVAQDGHTRIRAALDLGYTHVYVYEESFDPCIADFASEAVARNVFTVADMPVLSDEDYRIKWDKFCDDFFGRE